MEQRLLRKTMMSTITALLVDEEEARRFCRTFLVPYGKARLFQVMTRNKYAGGMLSRNSLFLERKILSFDHPEQAEEDFIRGLRKAEVLAAAGMYRDRGGRKRDRDTPIALDWMVAYITAYPLDTDDACDSFIAHVLERRKEQRRALTKSRSAAEETLSPAVPSPMSQLQSFSTKVPAGSTEC
jgi:hypothetical protein